MLPARFPAPRFTLKSLLILIFGIAIGFSLNLETWKLLTGRYRYTSQPHYVVEPPDVLQINVTGGDPQNLTSISTKCLVGPDGRVNLKEFGNVYVAGMTLEQAQVALEQSVGKTLASPRVAIDVYSYNSKKYYVITQSPKTVTEFPITGNETVLDAIAQLGKIPPPGPTQISVVRPAPNGVGSGSTLVVNWDELTSGRSDATNYQLQPRDRVMISQQPIGASAN